MSPLEPHYCYNEMDILTVLIQNLFVLFYCEITEMNLNYISVLRPLLDYLKDLCRYLDHILKNQLFLDTK